MAQIFYQGNHISWYIIHDSQHVVFRVWGEDVYNDIDVVLECEKGQHPPVLKEYLGKKITAETFITFDSMFGIFGDFDELIQEQFIWPKERDKLTKLKPFIEVDRLKLRKQIREVWV